MKLVSFRHRGMTRIGAVTGESVVDGDADPALPREMCAFLAAGPDA
ncbi:MAG: fumarylacetoacetate hydrolase, partial [Gammaproteobacteria bacterium]